MNLFKVATLSFSLTCLITGHACAGDMGVLPSYRDIQPAPHSTQFNPAQLAEMQSRIELANAIAQNVALDAQAKDLDGSWRVSLLSSLLNTPSMFLRSVAATAGTLDQVHAQVLTSRTKHESTALAQDVLGDMNSSLVYTPVTPCRFIDSRVSGDPLTFNPRAYLSSEDGGDYGGTAGCKLGPTLGALAISANITVVSPAGGPGFLAVGPVGSTQQASWLNWSETGPSVAIANAGIITTNQVGGDAYEFQMYVGGNAHQNVAQVIVDFFGYFANAQSPSVQLNCQDVNVNSVQIGALQVGGVTAACGTLGAGFSLTGGGCDTTGANTYLLSSKVSSTDPNSWTCKYNNQDGTATKLIAAYAKCCIVPAH